MTSDELAKLGSVVLSIESESDRPGGGDSILVFELRGRYWVWADWMGEPLGPNRTIESALVDNELHQLPSTVTRVSAVEMSAEELSRMLLFEEQVEPGTSLELNGEKWLSTAEKGLTRA